ncbi:VirB4 family type IV secretion system protein [Agathobaculum butyriciproducens]|uniref:VirB4 family type IV secretion system protein n=1 Tax=Agathobaculum butyriciproducens TaxID=1628085 RepID=UPI003AF00495
MNIKDAIFGAQSPQKLAAASDDLQGSLPIADIDRGIIYTRDGGLVGLFEVLPMNFFLQSTSERVRIVGALAAWLKIAPNSVQILGLSQPVDVEQYTRRMHEYAAAETDASCQACIKDNIEQVRGMIQGGAFTTRFFVAYRFEPDMAPTAKTPEQRADALYQIADTAKGYLARCGLTVAEPQYIDNQMVETVFGMLCKQTSRNIKLPVDFRLMMEDYFDIPTENESEDDEEPTSVTEESSEVPSKKKRRKKRKKAKQKADQSDGTTRVMDLICPSAIDMTHRDYLVIDGVCHTYLYIAGYGYQSLVRGGWLAALVGMGDGVSISTTLLRRPREKILPKVANSTIWSRSRMRDVDDTRADYEQMGSAIYAGQYIKQQMNTANEDYYDMYTLIEVTAANEELLHTRLAEVERLCASQDIICKRCDYVEEQAFHSFLPVVSLAPEIARKARRNTLLSGAAAAFPFYSMELCEQNGILIGEDLRNHAVCMLDIFDGNRYSNANMTVLGMSGAGKTYLLQLIAMRYRQQSKQVFLIAPYKGYEYRAACEAIGGLYIKLAPSSTDCINFLEIRRRTLDVNAELTRTRTREDSLLADKISRLHIYFSLLRRGLTEDEKSRLDVELMRLYERFDITRDNDSLYDEYGNLKSQPTPADFYELLNEREETRSLAGILSRFVNGSAANLGGETNVDMNNKYIVLDISEIGKELLPFGTLLAADICLDYCRMSRAENKVVILDEVWSLIGAGSNAQAAEFVLELFKTVRGYGASAIAASQDLEDFFALENGKFGKALLNNSRIKFALMTEPEEAMLIQQHYHLTDEEMQMHANFTRGQALLCAGRNRLGVQIIASPREHELITTDPRDIARIRQRQHIEEARRRKRPKKEVMNEDD